jgi:hypothetical protein
MFDNKLIKMLSLNDGQYTQETKDSKKTNKITQCVNNKKSKILSIK